MHDVETQALLTFLTAVVGSGLGTAFVGAGFAWFFNRQLESYKALLQRSGKIHERQVEALSAIHYTLEEAYFNLQRVINAGKFQGQPSDQQLLERMGTCLGQKLDDFFKEVTFAGIDINIALDPMVTGDFRAKQVDKAREATNIKIPSLLKAVSDEARTIIHR
jgi:hypothetical protein